MADANDLDAVSPGVPHVQGRERAPHPGPRAQPHRLRLAGRGLAEGPRRALRRRRGAGDQALPRHARGRGLLRSRRRLRALRRGHRRPRPGGSIRPGRTCSSATAPRTPSWPTRSSGCSAGTCPRAGRTRCRRFPPDAEGDRQPRLVGSGAERGGPGGALAARRARPTSRPRPRRRLTFDGAGDFQPASRLGAQPPLRDPGARLGRHRQRDGPDQAAALLVGLPHLLGLRPRRDPALGPDGDPGRAHLHPRLDRRRRGRADPPAGRAAGLVAGDAGAAGVPAGRRQRGRRDLADRDCRSATSPRCWSCPARRCPPSTGRGLGRRLGVARGAYVLAEARRATPTSSSWPPARRCSWRWRPGTSSRARASRRGW